MAYDPGALIGVLARHGVGVIVVAGSERPAPGGDMLASVLEVFAERSIEQVRALCAALVELDATLFIGDSLVGDRFRRVPAIIGRSWVWNVITDAGRINLSFLPPGEGGFATLAAASRPIAIGDVSAPAADLLAIIPFKGRMRDRWVLPSLTQIGQWQDELQIAERQQHAGA